MRLIRKLEIGRNDQFSDFIRNNLSMIFVAKSNVYHLTDIEIYYVCEGTRSVCNDMLPDRNENTGISP